MVGSAHFPDENAPVRRGKVKGYDAIRDKFLDLKGAEAVFFPTRLGNEEVGAVQILERIGELV